MAPTISLSDVPIPSGYVYETGPSGFVNHIGRIFTRQTVAANGTIEHWAAIRIEQHHVNSWDMAHGALVASMAEIATGRAGWDPAGLPAVAIDLTLQFIGAPRLGDLLEACGTVVRRSRSLIFTQAHGRVADQPIFVATSIQKIIGG